MKNNADRLGQSRRYWDSEAATFDSEPDHGLHDPVTRAAWRACFERWLPTTGRTILDIGCGTGSLSVLLSTLGHYVTGIDVSPTMLARAEAKASSSRQQITFKVDDAADPHITLQRFDVIVCRHVLWSLPDRTQALRRWAELLLPSGCMILIEGFWHTGAGLHAQEIVEALPSSMTNVAVHNLSLQPRLWGKAVADVRYAVLAERLAYMRE